MDASALTESKAGALGAAFTSARAAARTAFYAGATVAAARLAKPLGVAEREYGRHALRDAFELHREVLARPGMNDVMRKAEREDLATLPFFLASVPLDLARLVTRTRGGKKRGAVRAQDDFPYPDYYLNDFHHQSNGNLSLRAALTYEWQIRFLFMGTNRIMRQALIDEVPLGDRLELLDVGCGTASWLTQARLQDRRHRVTGIDLSPHYLGVATAFRGKEASFRQMDAAKLDPAWTGLFDAVTCIWLFHELPPHVTRAVTAEIARVLRPGGRLYFMDAAQPCDVPDAEEVVVGISEVFRDYMNEPYFRLYQGIDLPDLFTEHGLTIEKTRRCYASKVVVARKA
ncbi:MAG: class I SAM-dependent methyltransferase [Labilithrix sp.]|nr:class I SAM-dependent methyltransferase [Labilithrix sp.]MCW5815146.1 class I SAM-dependent methyltransferase [Labilithrix sp.]